VTGVQTCALPISFCGGLWLGTILGLLAYFGGMALGKLLS